MIESLHECNEILDAGCGCGGDLPKWGSKNVVYACDPNTESLAEAKRRSSCSKAIVHFFNGDISCTPIKSYDAICFNFSIQYVFMTENLFLRTIQDIQKRSKIGTKLVGVVPDSEELILHKGNMFRRKNFTGGFGDMVEFFIKGAPYYKNGPVLEPVCYREVLITNLEKIGFRLDLWEHFIPFFTGTVSDLYSKFIFTRIR